MKPTLAAAAAAVAHLLASAPVYAEVDHRGGHAQEGTFSAGEPGDPRKPARIVQVTMTEVDGKMLFILSRIEIAKDQKVRRDAGRSGVGPMVRDRSPSARRAVAAEADRSCEWARETPWQDAVSWQERKQRRPAEGKRRRRERRLRRKAARPFRATKGSGPGPAT